MSSAVTAIAAEEELFLMQLDRACGELHFAGIGRNVSAELRPECIGVPDEDAAPREASPPQHLPPV